MNITGVGNLKRRNATVLNFHDNVCLDNLTLGSLAYVRALSFGFFMNLIKLIPHYFYLNWH